MKEILSPLFNALQIDESFSEILTTVASLVVLFLIALGVELISKLILAPLIRKSVRKTKMRWDDILFDGGFFNCTLRILPPILILTLFPLFFPQREGITELFYRISVAYLILRLALAITSLLDSVNEIYHALQPEHAKKRPVKSYIQMIKVFIAILAGILIITKIVAVSAVGILSGLGAMSAVLMLIFKDSIMGLVSSFQLSANDMVRIGDWIEMPKYGADGDVIDVTLQSVKVRNWDLTITTIPIYALISDSFKNWRGMSESKGRRIKRAIHIDIQSVRFLSEEEKKELSTLRLLNEYMVKKEEEIRAYNKTLGIAESDRVSGRALTNLGTYRAYVSAYLNDHPMVEKGLTHMVRYLESGPNGLPMELYLFSADKAWVHYESIQADIIDHLLAVMGEFGLRAYQAPSGYNIESLQSASFSSVQKNYVLPRKL